MKKIIWIIIQVAILGGVIAFMVYRHNERSKRHKPDVYMQMQNEKQRREFQKQREQADRDNRAFQRHLQEEGELRDR